MTDVDIPLSAPAADLANTGEIGDQHRHHHRYIPRQLSDLAFNDRLLDLAASPDEPLLERLKFLALFSERIDEFFQVQVAGLRRMVESGSSAAPNTGKTPNELGTEIRKAIVKMVERQDEICHEMVLPALKNEGIELLAWHELTDADLDHLDGLFHDLLLPVLTPLTVDQSHPFPYISNLSLNVGVDVRDPGGEQRFARVKVPGNVPRLIQLPGGYRFIPIEQLIAHRLDDLFPGMHVGKPFVFRVTRDADFTLEDDDTDDLLKALQEELRRRRFLPIVRVEIDHAAHGDSLEQLVANLGLQPADVYRSRGPLGLECLWTMHNIDRPDLCDKQWTPVTPAALASADPDEEVDIFSVLSRRDVLVHHPYESFSASVEALVRQAADDPHVLAIKQCLYRTSGDSPIASALIRAAEHGKQVAVLVEVTARFDEEANIAWARALEEAGAHVVYGIVGLKTHSKTTLVVRAEAGSVRRYWHIGTGNYNSSTARRYEDVGYLSSGEVVGKDLTGFFNYITGFSQPPAYEALVTSPSGIRNRIIAEIETETAKGAEGRIIIKVNGLDDHPIIDAIYAASAAGVNVDLIIRGICCLRPGMAGLSENIKVRSIVGRFLEHGRILRFGGADGQPARFFIGSADLRRRNLDRRVEAMMPVVDPDSCADLDNILALNLADDTHAWALEGDGTWIRSTSSKGISAHEAFQELARQRAGATDV